MLLSNRVEKVHMSLSTLLQAGDTLEDPASKIAVMILLISCDDLALFLDPIFPREGWPCSRVRQRGEN